MNPKRFIIHELKVFKTRRIAPFEVEGKKFVSGKCKNTIKIFGETDL
jgi:hypothetical protein